MKGFREALSKQIKFLLQFRFCNEFDKKVMSLFTLKFAIMVILAVLAKKNIKESKFFLVYNVNLVLMRL